MLDASCNGFIRQVQFAQPAQQERRLVAAMTVTGGTVLRLVDGSVRLAVEQEFAGPLELARVAVGRTQAQHQHRAGARARLMEATAQIMLEEGSLCNESAT